MIKVKSEDQICPKNITQFKATLEILKQFQKISGLAVILTKTKISPFGKTLRLQYLADKTRLKIVNSFKSLGCIFYSELENLSENFRKAISAMCKENSGHKEYREHCSQAGRHFAGKQIGNYQKTKYSNEKFRKRIH